MWRDRFHNLAPYLFGSYFLAFLELGFSPYLVHRWAGVWFERPGVVYFSLIFGLSIWWIVVVVRGFRRCGWPAILMLPAAPLGLLPFWAYAKIIALIAVCVIKGDCL